MARGAVATRRRESADGLARVFDELRPELLAALACFLGSREDALDVAQETFLKCWRTRADLAEVRDLRSWIFRVGLNAARDLQRSAWRRRARPLELAPPGVPRDGSPADALERQEAVERVRDALVALRAEEREVFLLRQNSDLTYEEIAVRTRSPVGTVKTRMRSALFKLRKELS